MSKWTFRVPLTDPQYEVLKKVAEASGETLEEYLKRTVVDGLRTDVDFYFGPSEAIRERLLEKLQTLKSGKNLDRNI